MDPMTCLFLFLVLRVHGRPGDGDVCRFPEAELGAEVGRAAGDDRHLLTADRSFLHLAVSSLRHSPPQHRVSFLVSPVTREQT